MRLALFVLALFIVALAATTKKEEKRQVNHYLPYYGPNNLIEPRQFRPTRTTTLTQISTLTYTLTCVKSTVACPTSSTATSITPTPTSSATTATSATATSATATSATATGTSATATATSATATSATATSATATATSATATSATATSATATSATATATSATATSATATATSATATATSATATATSATATATSATDTAATGTAGRRRRGIDNINIEAEDWVNEQLSIVPSNVQGVEATQLPVREGRDAAAQFPYTRRWGMIPPFGYYDPQEIQPGFDNDPTFALPYYGTHVQPAAISQPRIFFGAVNALFSAIAITRTETITSFTVIAKTLTSSPTCIPPGIVQCAA